MEIVRLSRAAEPLEFFEGSTACMFAPHDVSHNWLRSLQTTWMRLDLALEAVTKSYARCERRLPLSLLRGWRLEPSPTRAADCAICQEPIADGALRLPCGHLYHEPCMRAWMHSHSSCPTCRFELGVCDGPGTDAA